MDLARRPLGRKKEDALSEQQISHGQLPGYIAGDDIVVGPFSFRHEMNVVAVCATFKHEDGEHEIQLCGDREEASPDQTVQTYSGPRHVKFGKARLEGFVDGDDLSGVYRCVGLTAYSYSDKEISFADTPDLRFVVVREPSKPPVIAGRISLSSQHFDYHASVYDPVKDEWDRGEFVGSE